MAPIRVRRHLGCVFFLRVPFCVVSKETKMNRKNTIWVGPLKKTHPFAETTRPWAPFPVNYLQWELKATRICNSENSAQLFDQQMAHGHQTKPKSKLTQVETPMVSSCFPSHVPHPSHPPPVPSKSPPPPPRNHVGWFPGQAGRRRRPSRTRGLAPLNRKSNIPWLVQGGGGFLLNLQDPGL